MSTVPDKDLIEVRYRLGVQDLCHGGHLVGVGGLHREVVLGEEVQGGRGNVLHLHQGKRRTDQVCQLYLSI